APADLVAHAEYAGTSLRGHVEGFLRGDPPPVVERGDPREIARPPHRLEHVLRVRRAWRIGAHTDADAALEHEARGRHAGAQAHVAGRVVSDAASGIPEALQILAMEPHAVGRGESRAQQAEVPEVRGQRLAVLLDADHR